MIGCLNVFLFLKAVFLSSILQKQQQLRTPTLSFMLTQVFNKGRIVYSWNLSNKPVVLTELSHRYLEKEGKNRTTFLSFQKSTAQGKFRARSCMFEFTSLLSIFLLLLCPCKIIYRQYFPCCVMHIWSVAVDVAFSLIVFIGLLLVFVLQLQFQFLVQCMFIRYCTFYFEVKGEQEKLLASGNHTLMHYSPQSLGMVH